MDLSLLLQDLRELVECESPSSDLAAVARSADLVARIGAARLGVEPEYVVLDGRTHLRWRFDGAPTDAALPPFRHLLLRDARGDAAWFATRAEDATRTLHVHDAWTRDGGATPSHAILLALLRAARQAGFAVISVELATNAERLQPWRDLGFEARSRRPVFGTDFRDAADGDADLHLTPSASQVLHLCDRRSVAEVSALVALPIGVVRVLLGDLVEQGLVEAQATLTEHSSKDERIDLLERTLRGLRSF